MFGLPPDYSAWIGVPSGTVVARSSLENRLAMLRRGVVKMMEQLIRGEKCLASDGLLAIQPDEAGAKVNVGFFALRAVRK